MDNFVFRSGLAFEMYDIKCVLVHLFDDKAYFAHTPYVIRVSDVYFRVDIKFTHLTLLLRLHVVFLPL